MDQIITKAISDFLNNVEDFSVDVVLAVNRSQQKAQVCSPDMLDGQWEIFPIRKYIRLNDKGFLIPDEEMVKKLASGK